MSGSVDRALVLQLLEDESLSYREIARQVGCSDWTVRSIARDVSGDARTMKGASGFQDDAKTTPAGWVPLLVIGSALAAAVWLGIRRAANDGGPLR
jgi:hypothetical protein